MIIQRLSAYGVRSPHICNATATSVGKIIESKLLFLQRQQQQRSDRPVRHMTTEYRRTPYDEHLASIIGNREMVGFGMNGQPMYADLSAFPFPAIRYKEHTPEIMALHEKEKGDWRLLSIREKKELYRASYCQTFAEFQFVTSEWMYIVGWTLINVSIGIWLFLWFHHFVYNPYPRTFAYEWRVAQFRRMIDLQVNPLFGLSSNWDYEKNDWKKKGWFTPDNPFWEEYCEDDSIIHDDETDAVTYSTSEDENEDAHHH